jgi:hypothetical protein
MIREPIPSPQPPAQAHETARPAEPEHEKTVFSWRLFWLLALMMLLASLILLPYAVQLLSGGRPEAAGQSAAARNTLILQTIAQTVLLYWPIALIGLLAARRIGLGLPYLHALIEGRPLPNNWPRMLSQAVVVGFGTGLLILAITTLLSPLIAGELARLSASTARHNPPNAWLGLFGSISAGVNEEILLRLFLFSALAWLIQRILGRPSGRPAPRILWSANMIAALIFGLLHLPNLAAIGVPLSPLLLVTIFILNGLAGSVFGWLFWTFGLEAAMLAHIFSDIVLHVMTVPLHTLIQ